MKKTTTIAILALAVVAFATGACKSKEAATPAPMAPGYVYSGK